MIATGKQDETKSLNEPRTARIMRHVSDDISLTKHSITSKSRGSSVPPRCKIHEGKREQTNYRASQSCYYDDFTRLVSKQDRFSSTQTKAPKREGSSVPPKQPQRRDKALKQDNNSVSSMSSKKDIKNKTPKCSTYVVDCPMKSSRNSTSKSRHDAKSISSQSGRFTSKSTGESVLSVATKKSQKKKSKRRNKDVDEGATRTTQASKRSILSAATDRIKRIFSLSSRQSKHRSTDETSLSTPVDVLNIPVDHLSRQDLPAFVTGDVETNEPGHDESDQSLTLGAPKRERKKSFSEADSDVPVSCLTVPILDMSQSECSSAKSKDKLKSRKSSSRERNANGMEVCDLPWTNGVLYGKYSGPINSSLQPHGKGTLKICGVWKNGAIVYPEIHGPSAKVVSRDAQTAISISSVKANKHIIIPAAPCRKIEDEPTAPLTTTSNDAYVLDKLDSLDKSYSSRLSRSQVSSSGTEYSDNTTKFRTHLCRNVHFNPKPPQKYHIGEVARSPNDMIIHRSYFDAIDSVSMIQNMQQVFVKRSNGLWTCAVLVERALQPINSKRWYSAFEINSAHMKLEESMLFVINDDGSTKVVNKRNWGKFVRRMKTNMNDDCDGVSERNIHSRPEDVTKNGDPVDGNSGEDANRIEDGPGKDMRQHSTNNYEKGEDKTMPCTLEAATTYDNGTSKGSMDATREFQDKRIIGDDIEQISVKEQHELDKMKKIFEEKEKFPKHGEEMEFFARNSTSTASTSLRWSSLSHSSSFSNSILLSKSMLNDID